MSPAQKANQLIHELSPYLLQHAYNPVHWFPWGNLALTKAREENKPILLSIGYAACHWCHVMAHESFEDETTAQLMNELFINIKVDKEERPDLDKIYQSSHYLLNHQAGGWPLTVFLTPQGQPFFSGTYFPKEEHSRLPSFKRVLQAIADFYKQQPDQIKQQIDQLQQILNPKQDLTMPGVCLNGEPLKLGLQRLIESYDLEHGGFGHAPKFPQASKIEYLLEQNSDLALDALAHLSQGGIYDQLAGGFFRYSVDERWNIPHFEKMLYDNGQLLTVYAKACKKMPCFNKIVYETAEWLIQNFQATEGGFFSSFDADSEGVEGRYYVWGDEELLSLLTKKEYALISNLYGLTKTANFEGFWHFYSAESFEAVCQTLKLKQEEAEFLLKKAKEKLLNYRNQRIAPHRDEKILTAWNGLAIKGLVLVGQALKEARFIEAGQKGLHFIQNNLFKKNKLFASYKEGKAYLRAYLDDYVFLLDALITSLQVSWNSNYLFFALKLADEILNSFADTDGSFFFTAHDHEQLLFRPKTMADEAIPSGNGILVRVFLIMGYLLGRLDYVNAAEKILKSAWPLLEQYPAEHCSLLLGLKEYLNPKAIIIIRGEDEEIKCWQEDLQLIDSYCFAIPNNETSLPEALSSKRGKEKICAYLCQGFHCEQPIESREQLKSLYDKLSKKE